MPRARSVLAASLLLVTSSVVTNAPAATAGCGDPATPIHDLHRVGSGPAAALTVEAVVTGDHQGPQGLSGFFVQEEDADRDDDAATSEGLFVRDAALETPVKVGDLVRIEGALDTAAPTPTLVPTRPVTVCSERASVSATELELPLGSLTEPKALEGMLIRVQGPLVVTDLGDLHRHGEVVLSWGDRLYQPTQVAAPGAPAREVAAANALGRLGVDDGSSLAPDARSLHASVEGPLRAGDELDELVGVLVRDGTGFEVHPPGPLLFRAANPRPAAPEDPGGALRVAAFNVKNYFATLADGSARCGPGQNLDCRGAKDATERRWQRAKVAAVVRGLAADILALVEVENDDGRATEELAADASAGELVYDWIDTGPLGSDAIRVALLYRPDRVAPRGAFAVLDRSVEPSFDDLAHRPVLAQTFEELSSGERLTVAVHHLKSKGSPCQDDPALDDGQGACNATRTRAAAAEGAWLLDDPTASGDPDLLVLGDLNAYGAEAPVDAFLSAGYRDLTEEALGARAYSYAFEGRFGLLDPVFASPALEPQVAGVTLWHVNADEAAEVGAPPETFDGEGNVDPFRASDHDPVIVALRLAPAVEQAAAGPRELDASAPAGAAKPSIASAPDAADASEEPSLEPPEPPAALAESTGCSFTARPAPRGGWVVVVLFSGWCRRRAGAARRLP